MKGHTLWGRSNEILMPKSTKPSKAGGHSVGGYLLRTIMFALHPRIGTCADPGLFVLGARI